MSKLLVKNSEDHTQVPFLRGILTRSLQIVGLKFEEAHHLATKIRSEIEHKSVVTTKELEKLVIEHLADSSNKNAAAQYENRNMPYMLQVETDDGQFVGFSPPTYRADLESIGLSSEQATDIVDELCSHLLKRNKTNVTSRYIGKITYRMLRKSSDIGETPAHRWLVWRDFVHSGRPIVYLIGGTAGCGKSTVATLLASRLDIPRMQSTDMLREVMRMMIAEEVQPILHRSSFTAWKEIPEKDGGEEDWVRRIIEGYTEQAKFLSVAIQAVVERALHERVSVVIEGVHVHPAFIESLVEPDDAVVVPVMLGVYKKNKLLARIKGRSTEVPRRRVERYQKYFDQIWALQSYLLSEADAADVPIISDDGKHDVFREVMLITINKLAEDFDKTPEQVFG
ncbi:MAG: hypothetical protein BMS9Abin19_0824 [Gammaproteobacteria bacterium]|nr:MAG: hypothetical protein BMS9Abin19_0824 [Gammaproteobacteria bacterium]